MSYPLNPIVVTTVRYNNVALQAEPPLNFNIYVQRVPNEAPLYYGVDDSGLDMGFLTNDPSTVGQEILFSVIQTWQKAQGPCETPKAQALKEKLLNRFKDISNEAP